MAENNSYEGMFLIDSGRFASNPEGSVAEVLRILEKSGATVVANRPWQDGRLAYAIEGRRKGLHYLTYFRMPGSGVEGINRACKLSDVILRHLVIKHSEKLFEAMVDAVTGNGSASESAKSGDAKSGDAKSGDAKSGDAKSGDAKLGDAKSGDATESTKSEATPADKPPVVKAD